MNKVIFKCTFFLFISTITLISSENWQVGFKQKVENQLFPHWMEEQINEDFSSIKRIGISKEGLDKITRDEILNNSFLFVRFEIKEGKLFTRFAKKAKWHPRYQVIRNALESLCKTALLPDLDFIVCLDDSLPKNESLNEFTGPVFVFAKHAYLDKNCILMPDFEALNGYSSLIGEVERASKRFPWQKKISKAVWRGASTGGHLSLENLWQFPRIQLVDFSLNYPEFIDARLTALVQIEEPARALLEKNGYKGNSLSTRDHLRYKYQILVDGNSCAYSRAIWELFSNSAIIKNESPNIQWYYNALQPYVHYIPVANDFNDLLEKILWANTHGREVQEIIINANSFAKNNLLHEDVMLYLYLTLNEYSRLQNF